jgi:monofunctional biosynthetic peptidoglycan transglycosylase
MIRKLFKFILKTVLWFVSLSVLWVLLYGFLNVPFTPLMAIRYFESDTQVETKHEWVPISEISPKLQLAIICAEDQNFTKHTGFDLESIKKAMKSNRNGKRLRGGSTISQQTAKNVFLWPQRSWFRKGMETYFTFLIETCWSKERILEVYLNSIEMGEGIYGAEAAAQYWFQKEAQDLSSHEAAAIAAILPNPRKYNANPRTAYLESRKQWILQQMKNYGTFTVNEIAEK